MKKTTATKRPFTAKENIRAGIPQQHLSLAQYHQHLIGEHVTVGSRPVREMPYHDHTSNLCMAERETHGRKLLSNDQKCQEMAKRRGSQVFSDKTNKEPTNYGKVKVNQKALYTRLQNEIRTESRLKSQR